MKQSTRIILHTLMPIRVVLRFNDAGHIVGLTEDFNMGWSDIRVRVWWSKKGWSQSTVTGKAILSAVDGVTDAEHLLLCESGMGGIVVDPLAPGSPITLDWDSWVEDNYKSGQLNAYFEPAKETEQVA